MERIRMHVQCRSITAVFNSRLIAYILQSSDLKMLKQEEVLLLLTMVILSSTLWQISTAKGS